VSEFICIKNPEKDAKIFKGMVHGLVSRGMSESEATKAATRALVPTFSRNLEFSWKYF
jgi:hypothetical protein